MANGRDKASAKAQRDAAQKLLADNRLARHQYEIIKILECGIVLLGTEVKSIRAGQVNLRDGFCLIRRGELQLHNVHISPHSGAGAYFNHQPLRTRILLAHSCEIEKFRVAVDQKGLTLVPLNLHMRGSWIKASVGLVKGRKIHDKREEARRKADIRNLRLLYP